MYMYMQQSMAAPDEMTLHNTHCTSL